MLDMLIQVGRASGELLANQLGLAVGSAGGLEALGYAAEAAEGDGVFHAVAQLGG